MASKKETFIAEVIALTGDAPEKVFSPDALDFWNGLNATGDKEKAAFTENGKMVLRFMQENKNTYNNLFKSKDIGAAMSISSRTVSGAMRKLTNDGYVEKLGADPVIYGITSKGEEVNLDAEEG